MLLQLCRVHAYAVRSHDLDVAVVRACPCRDAWYSLHELCARRSLRLTSLRCLQSLSLTALLGMFSRAARKCAE